MLRLRVYQRAFAGATLFTLQRSAVSTFATTFWKANGNAGTTAGTSFIGTIDSQPIVIKTGANEAMRMDTAGNVETYAPLGYSIPGGESTHAAPDEA